MNILYIGRNSKVVDGGTIVALRNQKALQEVSANHLFTLLVDHKDKGKKLKNILLNRPLGYDRKTWLALQAILAKHSVKHIFIEHSLLGGFCELLQNSASSCTVFFQNIEYLYYQHKAKVDGPHNRLLVAWAKRNEQKAVKYADNIICMTERDSHNLQKYYGRKADLIVPTTFEDKYTANKSAVPHENYHLFIGSNFFANVQGIKWYIENVLDHIPSKLVLIGKNMEFLKQAYPHKNMEVLGFVEDLEPYYLNANFVINPVFLGSGMKTKTIEALMYGKTIFGTQEAFVGIEPSLMHKSMLQQADNAEQFIEKIKAYNGAKWNEEARKCFLQHYDIQNTIQLYKKFLQ